MFTSERDFLLLGSQMSVAPSTEAWYLSGPLVYEGRWKCNWYVFYNTLQRCKGETTARLAGGKPWAVCFSVEGQKRKSEQRKRRKFNNFEIYYPGNNIKIVLRRGMPTCLRRQRSWWKIYSQKSWASTLELIHGLGCNWLAHRSPPLFAETPQLTLNTSDA